MNDLQYALRMLRKNPGFTLVAALTLAFGIGANGAVFSMVKALLLQPVPFAHLGRLTVVSGAAPSLGRDQEPVSPGDYLEWKQQSQSFQALGANGGWDANLTGGDAPERVRAALITPGMEELLSVQPALGRGFLAEEGEPGADGVVMLSHGLWTRRFGANPEVVGASIHLDGRERVVVGVFDRDFDFPRGTDLWTPLSFTPEELARRDARYLGVIGLLKPGVSRQAAQQELAGITAGIARRFPATHAGHGVRVRPLREALAGDVAPAFYGLLAVAAGLVLLVACANVANLLLARASARRREIAVRIAMGASRGRLLRQLLVESVLLALMGAAGGVWIAIWGVDFMVRSIPANVTRTIPGWTGFQVDAGVLAFAVAVAVVSGIAFGLAPALATVSVDVHDSLKEGQRSGGGGPSGSRARRGLVVAQVALALVLVSGAGLVVQGFQRLLATSPGFDPRGVLTLRVSLPESRYGEPARRADYQSQALERLRRLPGVTAAAAGTRLPWTEWGGRGMAYALEVSGVPAARPEDRARASVRATSGGYLETLRIPLIEGRDFGSGDIAASEPVAIVSRSLARRLVAGGDVVGCQVRLDHPRLGTTWRRVVGVCGDVTHTWWEPGAAPLCYVPFAQEPYPVMTLAVRTEGDPMALAPGARAALLALDRDQPVWGIRTLRESMDEIFSPLQLSSSLMTMFAILAMLLATIGLYGLVAYSVSQRTHEIGVRLALGAQRRAVLALIMRQGLTLAAIGLLIGAPAAWAMGRLAASKLFGVVALDPGLLAAISATLLLVALLASYLPARHASRVDPMVALRNE